MSGREITLNLPTEPGPNGIVTDRDKVAWQRRDAERLGPEQGGWPRRWLCVSSFGHGQALTWPELVASLVGLVVRWEGDPEPPRADLGDDPDSVPRIVPGTRPGGVLR